MFRAAIGLVTGMTLLAMSLVATGTLSAADPATIPVEDWSKQPEGKTGIPDGWKGQSWGSPKYEFRIVTQGGRKVLHLKSNNDSSTISKEIKVDIKSLPILQWSWQAVTLPKGGDARKSATDDQAAQLYVTFPRFPQQVRSRVISYIWDTTAPAGAVFKSEKTGLVTYVVVRSGPADLGKWLTESRNVLEDYQKIYGEAPGEEVGAVSISIDSNDTRSTAESYFGELLFRKP
ncbi:MAG TPA: DUF3047 domain-containing protein [Candidatus Udaeobacter sp.]|jgi:hypothetical protein|nr:DUF3047 domain-containing protein [Candidatus Udaeobacter sp.]